MGEPFVLPDGTPVPREAAIMGRTYRGEPSNMGLPLNYGQEFQNPAARIFRRGNPMDMAWRLLKNMDDDPFAEHRRMIDEMKEREAQINQQAQANAPRMTPQALSYQQQLDAKRAQEEHAQRIRSMLKEGRRRADVDEETEAFYQKYNRYPSRVPKTMRLRLDRLRERGD